jgi:hypothetical protein
MSDPSPIPFDELTPQVMTGDVILMHGTFSLSKAIQWAEGSYWTHSGFAVRGEDVGLDNTVYFWESNCDPLPDVRFHTDKDGPMLVPLRDRVVFAKSTTGDMDFCWRKLTIDRTPTDFTALWNFMPVVHNSRFPGDFTMLIDWLAGKWFHIATSDRHIFCAQLVAKTYQTLGWLAADRPANAFAPADFSATGHPELLRDASLGPEVHFSAPPVPPTPPQH